VPNRAEPNSSLTYYMHVGRVTYRHTRVAMALLSQMLTEPAFNILRTKEQLGYVVLCSSWTLPGSGDGGIRVSIQSERDPQYLEDRVEAFLDTMKTVIEAMGPKEFEEQKFGLERKWREQSKQLAEEVARYWLYIDAGNLDFFRRKRGRICKGLHDTDGSSYRRTRR
jgi:insulysin